MERVLVRLSRLNRTGVFLAVAGFVFLGLLLPGVGGAALLLALAAGLGWLLSRTWAVLPGRTRAVRLLILALLASLAIIKLI